jgi:electron transfer flavoprotein beta subunit
MIVAVALKWVDRRPEVDPLTGAVQTDPRTSGTSPADDAALEWGLQAAEAWGGEVLAVTAGPPGADAVLRQSLAAGAGRAVRVDLDPATSSEDVAAGLAPVVADAGLVLCGDWSLDRGSGSVPAYLAAHLGAAQALGCTDLAVDPATPGQVRAERRLDGGRRERVVVPSPGVVSVEGRAGRLRRAPLDGVLRARRQVIEVVAPARLGRAPRPLPVRSGPFRPRARALPPPPAGLDARQRVLALTGALVERTPPQLVVLEPAAAADRILDQLRAWGYVG